MSDPKHTTQLLEALPVTKAASKVKDTLVGLGFALVGVVAVIASFSVMMSFVDNNVPIGKWEVTFALLPLVAGIFLCLMGGLIASRELTSAAVKDLLGFIRGLFRLWRPNGSGAPKE